MSNKIGPRLIMNCRVYYGDIEQPGSAESVTLPEVEARTTEYVALGITGTPELPSGTIAPMQMTIVWKSLFPQLKTALMNFKAASQFQIRGVQDVFEAGELPTSETFNYIIRARPKMCNFGEFTSEDPLQPETEFDVEYIKLTIDGEQIFEVDALSPTGIRVGTDIVDFAGGGFSA